MDKDFNDIFGGVDWDQEYVSKEQAKQWFESVKDSIDTDAIWNDMKTYIVSGVDEPSHRSKFIDIKSEDDSGTISSELEYIDTKSDDELQIAKAAALVPSETDRDGEVIPPWLSVRTAHEFLANKNTDQIDEQHETPRFSKEAVQTRGEVVESHTLNEPKEYTTVHGETEKYPEGTWMIEVKFTDDETWEKVKNGEIKGYSIHARASKEKINKEYKESENDPCWENYEMVGIDENGEPICVPEEDAHETREYIKNNYQTEPDNKQSDDNSDNMESDNTDVETESEDEQTNMSTKELAEVISNSTPISEKDAENFIEQEGDYSDDEESEDMEDEESENSEQESTDEESDQKMDMEKITDMMEEMLDRVEDLEEDVYSDDADTDEESEDMEDEESENSEQESTDEESDQKSADVDRKVTNESAPVQKDEESEESEDGSVFANYWQ